MKLNYTYILYIYYMILSFQSQVPKALSASNLFAGLWLCQRHFAHKFASASASVADRLNFSRTAKMAKSPNSRFEVYIYDFMMIYCMMIKKYLNSFYTV